MFDIILNSATDDKTALEAFFGVAMEADDAGKVKFSEKMKSTLHNMAEGAKKLWERISGWFKSKFTAIKAKFPKIRVGKKKAAEYKATKALAMKRFSLLPSLMQKIQSAISSGKEVEFPREAMGVYSQSIRDTAERNTAYAPESFIAMEGAGDDDTEEFDLAEETTFLTKMQQSLAGIRSALESAANKITSSKMSPIHWLIKIAKAVIEACSSAFGKLSAVISDRRMDRDYKKAVKASFKAQDKAVADSKDENWA